MNVAMCDWRKNGTQFIEKERMKKFKNFVKTKSTYFPGRHFDLNALKYLTNKLLLFSMLCPDRAKSSDRIIE